MDETVLMPEHEYTPASAAVEKVTMKHPHTGDVQVVDGVTEQLVPLMVRGYQQVREGK